MNLTRTIPVIMEAVCIIFQYTYGCWIQTPPHFVKPTHLVTTETESMQFKMGRSTFHTYMNRNTYSQTFEASSGHDCSVQRRIFSVFSILPFLHPFTVPKNRTTKDLHARHARQNVYTHLDTSPPNPSGYPSCPYPPGGPYPAKFLVCFPGSCGQR